jgi:acyl-CoA reductase-like NAD-dependent aldehyde dehydrogenase
MPEPTTLIVTQAYDGAAMAELKLQDWTEIDQILERATACFRRRDGWLPAHRRREILLKLAGLVAAEAEAFALLIAREGGKPLTDARAEVTRAVNGIELAAAEIERLAGRQIPMDLTAAGAGRTAFTQHEPLGVVVAVSAFNHPLNLIVHQVVPAIATGCPVIVKPAEPTPLSCLRFVELVHEAGLEPDWCQACNCEIPVAERLVTDPRVAFLTFIGSARVGWSLRSKLAPGTRCALEHGGAAPVIVASDADLEAMVPLLVKGGYYHAGQVCVSVQRVFVDNRIKDVLLEAVSARVASLVVGDPTDALTEVGPLIRTGEVDRVEEWVREATDQGAICVVGGRRISDRVYAPTLLLDPSHHCRISTEEVFGPVVSIYGYDDEAEAVALANALPVAFQSAVFTRDLGRALRLTRALDAAAVMVNDHTAFRVDWMPFAGRRTSGLGVGGIPHTMADMSAEKLIVIKE